MSRSHVARITLGAALAASLAFSALPAALAASSTGWRIVYRHGTTGTFSSYRAIAVSGAGHAWAAGGTGVAGYGSPVVAYWHNGKWSQSPMPRKAIGTVMAISADSASDAWAVTAGDVLHWHAGKWIVARTWNLSEGPPGPLKTGITAFSPTNVWVFGGGSNGLGTFRLARGKWTKVTGPGRDIFKASAASATDMWAIGGATAGSILRYASGTWRKVSDPKLSGLEFGSIFASSPTSVWVTASVSGGPTGFRLLHLNRNQWTAYPIPWSMSISTFGADGLPLGSISPDGHGGFWISTDNFSGPAWMLHFSGGRWSRVRIGSNPIVSTALIPGTRSLWGTGSIQTARNSDAVVWAYGTRK